MKQNEALQIPVSMTFSRETGAIISAEHMEVDEKQFGEAVARLLYKHFGADIEKIITPDGPEEI